MKTTKITCKKCGQSLIVEYQSYYPHILTEEALAIDRATKKHQCKGIDSEHLT